jgi:hypothetical protein
MNNMTTAVLRGGLHREEPATGTLLLGNGNTETLSFPTFSAGTRFLSAAGFTRAREMSTSNGLLFFFVNFSTRT